MADKILVTGAAGNVGREVVLALQRAGQPVVAVAVDAADARRVTEIRPLVRVRRPPDLTAVRQMAWAETR